MCHERKETTNDYQILSFLLIFGELEIDCVCLDLKGFAPVKS